MSNALMELLKQKKAALASNRRAKTVKPEDGRSRWRILPGWREGDPTFYHDFGQHFIKDAAGEVKAVYICVDKTFGKPCSVCSAVESAVKSTMDDAMVELLKSAKAGHRILVNALHVDGPNPTEPVILELAPTVFEGILNIIMEWGEETLSLDAGKDVIIERSGKGKNTKYSVQIAAKSAPVDPAVMKKITNLDEYVAQESEEQAARALTNLSAVAGLLPAAAPAVGTTVATPSLRDLSIDEQDAALRELEGELAAPAPAPAPATPAPAVATPAAVAEAAPAATPAPAAAVTGDSELDQLLAALG